MNLFSNLSVLEKVLLKLNENFVSSPEIYRLNLERGQFLNPFSSEASEIMCCDINPVHNLLVCGTKEGRVEAWDPRVRSRVGTLDCALDVVADNK